MNHADLKAMMAEVGVTVEVLSAEELAAALYQPAAHSLEDVAAEFDVDLDELRGG